MLTLTGSLDNQPAWDKEKDPTLSMHPVPTPIEYDWGSKEDKMVEDMLSLEFWKLWSQTAMRNRAIFERIFRPVSFVVRGDETCSCSLQIPNNDIRSWKDYATYLQPSKGTLVSGVPFTLDILR
jgi:phospholipase D1/2